MSASLSIVPKHGNVSRKRMRMSDPVDTKQEAKVVEKALLDMILQNSQAPESRYKAAKEYAT
jgi:hypothetical protein